MDCKLYANAVEITVTDGGKGIEDIEQARQPMYTSRPEMERSGMGFTVMESLWTRLRSFLKWEKVLL